MILQQASAGFLAEQARFEGRLAVGSSLDYSVI